MENLLSQLKANEKVWFELRDEEKVDFLNFAKELGCTWIGGKPIQPDVDCNGEVNIADCVLALCYNGNSEVYPVSWQGQANGDVYNRGDGVNNLDALSIEKYLTNLVTIPESYLNNI